MRSKPTFRSSVWPVLSISLLYFAVKSVRGDGPPEGGTGCPSRSLLPARAQAPRCCLHGRALVHGFCPVPPVTYVTSIQEEGEKTVRVWADGPDPGLRRTECVFWFCFWVQTPGSTHAPPPRTHYASARTTVVALCPVFPLPPAHRFWGAATLIGGCERSYPWRHAGGAWRSSNGAAGKQRLPPMRTGALGESAICRAVSRSSRRLITRNRAPLEPARDWRQAAKHAVRAWMLVQVGGLD